MGRYTTWHKKLREWMRRNDVNELEFAKRIQAAEADSTTLPGSLIKAVQRPPTERVKAWTRVHAKPSPAAQAFVEIVTEGEVRPEDLTEDVST